MKVLVTDDEPMVLMAVRSLFESHGHQVDVCTDGRGAVRTISGGAYDLVVLDWMLPDVEGIDVVREVRARGHGVPVLMLTSRSQSRDLVRALDAGADDFVPKQDLRPEVLLARSEALYRRSRRGPTGRRIESQAIVVDEPARQVLVDGEPVALAASEFHVLAVLARERGAVVTREEIVQRVWGECVDVSATALESVVKRLRKKLGPHGSRVLTVRNRGYALTEESADAGER